MLRTLSWTVKLAGLLGNAFLRVWIGSLDFRFVLDDLSAVPHRMTRPAMYVLWHEMMLMPTYTHGRHVIPLVSRSWDGEFATQILRHFGSRAIRGSTNHDGTDRGGASAAWELVRVGQRRHVALTVDGPKGPRRTVARPGSIVTAARNEMPIVPLGVGLEKSWMLGPKDRPIALPMPLTRAWVVVGPPIDVPRKDRQGCITMVQDALDHCQQRAEALAAGETIGPIASLSLQALRRL